MQQKGSFSMPRRQAQIGIRKTLGAGDAAYRKGRGDGSARRGRSLIYTTPLLSMQAATQTGLHVLSHNGRMTFQQTTLQWTHRRLQERTNGKAMRLLVQSTLMAVTFVRTFPGECPAPQHTAAISNCLRIRPTARDEYTNDRGQWQEV